MSVGRLGTSSKADANAKSSPVFSVTHAGLSERISLLAKEVPFYTVCLQSTGYSHEGQVRSLGGGKYGLSSMAHGFSAAQPPFQAEHQHQTVSGTALGVVCNGGGTGTRNERCWLGTPVAGAGTTAPYYVRSTAGGIVARRKTGSTGSLLLAGFGGSGTSNALKPP